MKYKYTRKISRKIF